LSTATTDSAGEIRETSMNSGNIVEIIGVVVDAQFPRAAVPKIYDALRVES